MLPNLLIAGAAKAGSSTLYHYLGEHPDVCMSSGKEPAFFTKNWKKGIGWYESQFVEYSDESVIGEATVEYMRDPIATQRIWEVIPDVKFIFTLREPISRAVSHYWWRVHNGHESRSFDEVLTEGREAFFVDYGLYYTHISRFLDYFPLEHMHFVILERMASDHDIVFQEMWDFLELREQNIIQNVSARNNAVAPRSEKLKSLLLSIRKSAFKRLIPSILKPLIRRSLTLAENVNKESFEPPELRSDQIKMLKSFFDPEIEGLEEILGYELVEWHST